MKKHFCLQCGMEMITQSLENRNREKCPACGWIYYEHVKVGAAALVEVDDQLLLVKRAQDPWKDCWYLPAGFVEVDEDPRIAAERETREETGLQVEAGELKDVIFFDDDPRGNGILIVYSCKLIGGTYQNSLETLAGGFFSSNDLPGPIAGDAHQKIISRWKAEHINL